MTRLGVIRLEVSGRAFLARTLLDSGEDLRGAPFTEPEAIMDGIMNSGSTELVRESDRGDLRCDADMGVRNVCDSGCNDCRDARILRRGLGAYAAPSCASSVDAAGGRLSSLLSSISTLSAPPLVSSSEDTSAHESPKSGFAGFVRLLPAMIESFV